MASYGLDRLHGTLNIADTPIAYSPPRGSGIAFSTTYNQATLGQVATPLWSNFGPNWTYNYLSYVTGDPNLNPGSTVRYVPGGGVEHYPSFTATASAANRSDNTYKGTFAPERDSQAILGVDPANHRYTRTASDGSVEVYDHVVTDSSGNSYFLLTSQTDPQGNVTQLNYDRQNRLTTIVDAIGQVTTLSYNRANDPLKITQVTDPFGRSATFTYDSQGRLKSATDPLGMVSSYAYSGTTTFLNSLTTPYGTSTFVNESDSYHQAVTATNPLGQTERVEQRFNSVGIPDSETSVPTVTGLFVNNQGLSNNNTFYWSRREYADGAGDYTKAEVTHWMLGNYGLTHLAESSKRPLEGRVWNSYQGQTQASYLQDEALGKTSVTARVLDNGSTQSSGAVYNANGLVTESIDPLQRTTNYSYATNGIDLLQVAQQNGTSQDVLSTMTYNGQHLPLTMTDAAGQTTTLTYNGSGQMLTRTDPLKETTTMVYNGQSYLQSVTGPLAGATTSYTYDAVGRVKTSTDSEGYTLTMAYDNLDRPTQTTYPDGTSDQITYKNLDVAATTDRQNRTTHNQYDAIRELVLTIDPLGRTTSYTWCTCGGLSTLTDANGHVTTWNLDLQGRVTGKVYADRSATTYTYETTTSRLHQMVDALGSKALYTYNIDNTLAGTAYTPAAGVSATPNVSFTYDPTYNRVTAMTDGTGTTSYTYNPVNGQLGAGRLATVSSPINGTGKQAAIAYQYDPLSRVKIRAIDGSANTMTTQFDSLGRVTNLSNPLGAFTYAYVDTTSRLQKVTYPNGQVTNYNYYPNLGDQRLKEIQNLKGSTPLSDFQYTYNPVGTIATWAQQQDSSTPTSYALTYDAADQLTGAVQTNTATSATVSSNLYNYDPAGNRLAETTLTGTTAGQFNNLNQLIGLTGNASLQTVTGKTSLPVAQVSVNGTPAALANGTNFTANVPLPGGTNTFSVVAQDASGHTETQRFSAQITGATPIQPTYDKNGNTLTDEKGYKYTWDSLNRLISITYPTGAKSLFAYDGLSRRVQITEQSSGGAVTSTKNYLWVGSEIAEERDTTNTVQKRFFPQGEQQAGVSYYYTRDHLWSVREMCDSSGAIVSRMAYDPYGRVTVVSGTNLPFYQYAGLVKHTISGLDFAINRIYENGRWLSRDPIGEAGGIDLYDYSGNDPIDRLDPTGLKCKCGIKRGPEYDHSGTISGGTEFQWSAEFMNDATHSPSCCEVHQLISTNRVPLHNGFPKDMQPNTFYEDRSASPPPGQPPGTPPWRYGHHRGASAVPTMPGFEEYPGNGDYGRDTPSGWPQGTVFQFKLVVVDVCNGGKNSDPMYTSKTLTVTFP